MATFPEPASPNFDAIRQIETNDPVLGGAAEITGVVNSPINYALRALVARTQWLRQRVEGISTPAASRSQAGIARLASLAQVNAGSDDETIVTPFLLQQKVNAIPPPPTVPNASETQRGIAEQANQAEVNAGTDNERFMTPATFRNANIIRNITPASIANLQFRRTSDSSTTLSFTADIVGKQGIFKITFNATVSQVVLFQTGSPYWIPTAGEHLFFWDSSASRLSLVTVSNITHRYSGSNNLTTITFTPSLGHNDILYIPLAQP